MRMWKRLPNGDFIQTSGATTRLKGTTKMSKQNPMDDHSNDGKPFASREEMMRAMKDDQYRVLKDEAYIQRVQARMAATDFTATTGALINTPLPLGDNMSSDMDQINPDMPWGYQSVADFMKLIKSPEYKNNPSYRLAVEGAIAAATPDWQPRTQDDSFRVEIDPNIPGSGFDPDNSPAAAAALA